MLVRRNISPLCNIVRNMCNIYPTLSGLNKIAVLGGSEDNIRAIRGVLSGAATGRSERRGRRDRQEASLAQQALTGAVRSAMSGAARAIASAGRR